MIKCAINFVFLICCINSALAQTYYVKEGAIGTGTSWADASGDLQQILSEATAGTKIWVTQGTYYPITCNPCTEIHREVSFEIPDSVEIYGGFEGTESMLEQRNWESNETILSGDLGQDGQVSNNAMTIVYFTRVSAMTTLDGFSIMNGYAHKPGVSTSERSNSGAAIFNQGELSSESHPNIRNCYFENNSALGYGGAIYNNGGFNGEASPVFENCTFVNNSCELGGGAINNYANFSGLAVPVFTNCTFLNNVSNQNGGGAVYNQGAENGTCNPAFIYCHFEGNTTAGYGGGVHNHGRKGESNSDFQNCTFIDNDALFGGGVSNNGITNGESNATFTNCLFENNHVTGDGGGLYNWGSDDGESNAVLNDCVFRSNNSDFAGAGMFNNGINGECSASITNCQFIDNVAITYGAAIYSNGKKGNASPSITNCLFQNNSGNSGGGVYNLGSENGNASPIITNCTFFGNSANVGGAIYNNASDSTGTSSPVITNCIFWKNEANFGRVFRNVLGTPFIQHSVVDELDCEELNSGIGSVVSCGTGVLYNVYPEFEDTLNGNFRLKSNSPLLNLGNNLAINATGVNYDLDNQNRIFNDVVDFGAYEYFDAYIPPSITSQPQSATLCEAETLSLNINVEGTPPFSYQWLKNGIEINNATSSDLIINSTSTDDSGAYICVVTDSEDNAINSNIATVLIKPVLTPLVVIESIGLEFCENEEVAFVAGFFNGGDDPVFAWYLNGNEIGSNSNTIDFNALNNGDVVLVELISSLTCAQPLIVSDSAQVVVSPMVDATIEITGPDTVVCLGNEATFTSAYANGGNEPLFQWFANGIEIPGENESDFSTANLLDGDIISCQLTSSKQCVVEGEVVSNEWNVQIDSCLITNTLNILSDRQILINPNPSQGVFYLSSPSLKGDYHIDIIDVAGQILKRQRINFSGNGDNLMLTIPYSGMYFIKVFNEQELNIQKIVVDKK